MDFFSLKLCQEMQKAGLVSESGYFYEMNGKNAYDAGCFNTEFLETATPAFTALDLIAPTETARNNAKKWWPLKCVFDKDVFFGNCINCRTFEKYSIDNCFYNHIHKLIDLNTEIESIESYVKRTRKKE